MSTKVDRGKGALKLKSMFEAISSWVGVPMFVKRKSCCSLYRVKNACVKHTLSFEGPSFHFLPRYVDIDVIHMIKRTRPSPSILHTASDQKLDIKNWTVGRPGNEASYHEQQCQTDRRLTHEGRCPLSCVNQCEQSAAADSAL